MHFQIIKIIIISKILLIGNLIHQKLSIKKTHVQYKVNLTYSLKFILKIKISSKNLIKFLIKL